MDRAAVASRKRITGNVAARSVHAKRQSDDNFTHYPSDERAQASRRAIPIPRGAARRGANSARRRSRIADKREILMPRLWSEVYFALRPVAQTNYHRNYCGINIHRAGINKRSYLRIAMKKKINKEREREREKERERDGGRKGVRSLAGGMQRRLINSD